MLLGATWGSDPGGSSWVPGSSESSCQKSLGIGILEDSLRCHYFARVKFSCVASYECSSIRFFQFVVTVPLLICSTLEVFFVKDHMVLGGKMPSYGV